MLRVDFWVPSMRASLVETLAALKGVREKQDQNAWHFSSESTPDRTDFCMLLVLL